MLLGSTVTVAQIAPPGVKCTSTYSGNTATSCSSVEAGFYTSVVGYVNVYTPTLGFNQYTNNRRALGGALRGPEGKGRELNHCGCGCSNCWCSGLCHGRRRDEEELEENRDLQATNKCPVFAALAEKKYIALSSTAGLDTNCMLTLKNVKCVCT
jgi:hypothetical protein